MDTTPAADWVFEVSWEVCNKIGGINTVIASKAQSMLEHYRNYVLIGPYFKDKFEAEVTPEKPPEPIASAIAAMGAKGIPCFFGRWHIKGNPWVILIDTQPLLHGVSSIKTDMWNTFKVDSIYSNFEFDEPISWAWGAGMLLHEIALKTTPTPKFVAQCHEWLAGPCVLYLKKVNAPFATVFTTHATILGRTMAAAGMDLYAILDQVNPDEEAYRLGVQDKFTLERASAHAADVFTTVSDITGFEAEKLLGRKPEVLVYNGFDVDRFPTIEETSINHVQNLAKLKDFLTYTFFPYYTFDLSHTLIFFLLARYEYKNKGIDVTIEALARLNEELKQSGSNKTVVCFFYVPQRTYGIKTELLENKNMYRMIRSYVEMKSKEIQKVIIEHVISQKTDSTMSICAQDFLLDLRKDTRGFKRVGNPPLCVFNIGDEHDDAIVSNLLRVGLDNKEDDRVKAILFPTYLDGNDGILGMNVYETMSGSHLGLFPSYYEPWGYTPVECAAMGVSSVTSDVSGFGKFIQPRLLPHDSGIYILERFNKDWEQTVEGLKRLFHQYVAFDHSERVQNKINAKNLSYLADWKHMVKNYIDAHNLALERRDNG
ncbi:MAG: glycogen/starch synthase [Nanoarchaeota archaeon]